MRYPDLEIPKVINYLSQVITELPHNCIYDKAVTGCGGTTVALNDKCNYVICVPYVSLVQSKSNTNPLVFPVYADFNVGDFKKYLSEPLVAHKKIIVTYDSLWKVMKYIDPKDYKLLIDEVHCLFQQYTFRYEAIRCVLENYTKFKSFCFLTATMMEPEFTLNEFTHLPVVVADWEVTKEVTVKSVKCDTNVIHTVVHLVEDYLSSNSSTNAHFFVNSVELIKQVIKECSLNDDNCKAIWSKSNKTPMTITRGTVLDPAKKINFYTSCMFEGCDLFDVNGCVYIVSDSNRAHSLLDISTSFKQIAGRIRDTKYWDTIHHIYQTTRYDKSVSFETFLEGTNAEIQETKLIAESYNSLPAPAKKQVLAMFAKEFIEGTGSYLAAKNNEFIYDENLHKLDLYNYKITKNLYKLRVNILNAYLDEGFKFSEEPCSISCKRVKIISPKASFVDTVEELNKNPHDLDFQAWAYRKYPFLKEAWEVFGYKEIVDYKYNITNIKAALGKTKKVISKQDIKNILPKISPGTFLSLKDAKDLLQKTYNKLGIKSAAKGVDISSYYITRKTLKKIKGKVVKGLFIIK